MLCDDCVADCEDHAREQQREFEELVRGGLGYDDARLIVAARDCGRMPLA